MAADLMGPFPITRSGFEHIIVFTDYFAHYVIVILLHNIT